MPKRLVTLVALLCGAGSACAAPIGSTASTANIGVGGSADSREGDLEDTDADTLLFRLHPPRFFIFQVLADNPNSPTVLQLPFWVRFKDTCRDYCVEIYGSYYGAPWVKGEFVVDQERVVSERSTWKVLRSDSSASGGVMSTWEEDSDLTAELSPLFDRLLGMAPWLAPLEHAETRIHSASDPDGTTKWSFDDPGTINAERKTTSGSLYCGVFKAADAMLAEGGLFSEVHWKRIEGETCDGVDASDSPQESLTLVEYSWDGEDVDRLFEQLSR